MRKIEFLNELHEHLITLPKAEREEIIEDFRSHFREAEAAGKTEEQICRDLGTPLECAKQYIGENAPQSNTFHAQPTPPSPPSASKKRSKVFWSIALVWNVIQAFLSIPITLGLFLAVAIMIVAFCFIVPAVNSVAFLIFAISSSIAVLSLAIITLLWAAIEIKECIKMINK